MTLTLEKNHLTPVVRTTLTADICRKMVGELIRGSWAEGEKIPAERELSQKLGVGRASLREALKSLEIMGMIETRLGDGTYVCKRSEFFSRPLLWAIASSSAADARELVEARTVIEVELAGLAAEHATAENLKEIEEHLGRMIKSRKNPREFVQADIDFHLAIGRAASNSILINALHLIRNLMHQWILKAVESKGVADKACAQHRRVLAAIKNQDRTAARKEMRRHLRDMAEFVPRPPTGKKQLRKLARYGNS
jgi:GntR family transcriptional regulator, transcriptional repressor for pyruvate dehydrogenase complex